MKQLIFILLLLIPVFVVAKDIPTKGRVKIVTSNPDYRVKIVKDYPDLFILKTNREPKRDGEWKFVTEYPDFTIQYVNDYPDFTVKFVTSYPKVKETQSGGLNKR